MARSWREIGKVVFHHGRQVFPVLLSVGLVTWMIWKVTPQKLAQALSTSAWPWLALATAVQVIVLFMWDTISLWWLFSQPDRHLPFRIVFRARTDSVLWSAVNLEIGQAMFAYNLAQALGSKVLTSLGRCLALALIDLGTLQTLGLIATFVKPIPGFGWVRWICAGILGGLFLLALVLRLLPESARRWLESRDWGSWLAWWTWRHTLLLCGQRLILFLLVLVYAGVGLALCRVHVDAQVVFGVVPFVLMAESLPGTGGLGERETALVYLLGNGDKSAVLLSFGLIWSAGVLLGRVLIGLTSRWLPHPREEYKVERARLSPTPHATS